MSDGAPVDRQGLNRAEAAFLRAAATHGGEVGMLDAIEEGAANALRSRLEALEELEEDERDDLVDVWETDGRSSSEERCGLAGLVVGTDESQQRVPENLRSPSSTHFDALFEYEPEPFVRWAGDFGTFQFAELVRGGGRRKVARSAKRFERRRRLLMLEALERNRECERLEQIRIREVFVTFSRDVEAFDRCVRRLGLYSVACAAGFRFRSRLMALAAQLPDRLEDRLRQYYQLSQTGTRRGVEQHFRCALETFLEWRGGADVEEG